MNILYTESVYYVFKMKEVMRVCNHSNSTMLIVSEE